MVLQFFMFFTFRCFRGIFIKYFIKKLSLFNTNFWNSLQDLSSILSSITILNLVLLKWGPSQHNVEIEKNTYFTVYSIESYTNRCAFLYSLSFTRLLIRRWMYIILLQESRGDLYLIGSKIFKKLILQVAINFQ